jgi:hypothetical protein
MKKIILDIKDLFLAKDVQGEKDIVEKINHYLHSGADCCKIAIHSQMSLCG